VIDELGEHRGIESHGRLSQNGSVSGAAYNTGAFQGRRNPEKAEKTAAATAH
jgi:hypothetical protein